MPIGLDILPDIISSVRSTLFNIHNQDLLKLVYHDTDNPYAEADITPEQLLTMISPYGANCRIYCNSTTGKIADTARTEVHMYVDNVVPENRQLARLHIVFQIITHLDIASMYGKNSSSSFPNQNRHEAIFAEILKALNEKHVDGVGVMHFGADCRYQHQVWVPNEKWVGGIFEMVVMTT